MEENTKDTKATLPLKQVIINNFRSIEHLEINIIQGQPLILVGKNECGKSNILQAIQLLETKNFTIDDKKRSAPHNAEYSVEFIFDISNTKYIFQLIKEYLTKNYSVLISQPEKSASETEINSFISEILNTITYKLKIEPEKEPKIEFTSSDDEQSSKQYYFKDNEIILDQNTSDELNKGYSKKILKR